MRHFADPEHFASAVGETLGASDWCVIDQSRVDRFADVTGDRQWPHSAGPAAVSGPFGGPVAHGFLTLALLPMLLADIFEISGVRLTLNKEVRRARFRAPVRVGDRIRAVATLASARTKAAGCWDATISIVIELAPEHRNACTAELSLLLFTDTSAMTKTGPTGTSGGSVNACPISRDSGGKTNVDFLHPWTAGDQDRYPCAAAAWFPAAQAAIGPSGEHP